MTEDSKTVPSELKNLPVANADEVGIVKKLLGAIQKAFEDAHEKAERYEVKADQVATSQAALAGAGGSSSVTQLAEKTREHNKAHQKASTLVDKMRWTFRDASVLTKLAKTVS